MRRRVLWVLASLLVLPPTLAAGAGCALSAPTWRGPKSDHFDGEKFFNPDRSKLRDGRFLEWQLSRERGPWRPYREEPFGEAPPRSVTDGKLRVTFINHATTLIQLDGVNVLTDPVYSERASPFSFLGPKRVRPPGIRFEDLPTVHAIVLSHNHYDHLNVETLKRLQAAFPHVQLLAGLGNKAFLEGQGLRQVHELDWGDTRAIGAITVRSVRNQHFSNRGLFDNDGTLWSAWSFEGPTAGKAYFAGDTGYGTHFKEAGAKVGPFRLAVLPIGAYKPEWFMGPIHQSPAEAVQAAIDLNAKTAVPMHYGTFELADDGETEPLDALKAATAANPGAEWVVLGFGEGRDVP